MKQPDKQQRKTKQKRKGNLWQLVATIGVLVLSIAGMTGLLVNRSQTMMTVLNQLQKDDMQFEQHAQEAYTGFLELDSSTNMWVGLGTGNGRFGDDIIADDTMTQAKNGEQQLNDSLAALQKMDITDRQRGHVEKAITDAKAYLDFFHQIEQVNETDHRKAEQMQYIDNSDASVALTNDLQDILTDAGNRVDTRTVQTIGHAQFSNKVNWIGGGVLILLSLAALLFARRTINPIIKATSQLNEQLARIAQGDLTNAELKIKVKGEIGQLVESVNRMTGDLRQIIVHVKETATQVAASSMELSASAEMTNRASEEIASAIQEIAGGSDKQVEVAGIGVQVLQDINHTILSITGNAEAATRRATEASSAAANGSQAVHGAVEQMNSINYTMSHLEQVITGLGERSQHIGQIVESITAIAAQTNLLALNAAIESARAGEQGRGFAVVADEVRKLAEQSSESAQQIGSYIAKIQEEITDAVQTMAAGAKEVQAGTQVVFAAGESFEVIQRSIDDVAQQVQGVSSASSEMASSTQLSDAMRSISEAALSNAQGTSQASAFTEEQVATMEEIASSTATLSQMAEELQELVGKFQV
ncbi:MAG: methyl-accepting chemotaxis protein [Tumebacillaceae bacterium]